jgi:hypothetical protein
MIGWKGVGEMIQATLEIRRLMSLYLIQQSILPNDDN